MSDLPFAGIARAGEIIENPLWTKRIGHFGKLWPTPMARLGRKRGAQAKRYPQKGRSTELDDAVAYFGPNDVPDGVFAWPTPTVQDSENDGGPAQYRRKSLPLNAIVKLLPTPRTSDHRAGDELMRTERKNGKNLLSEVKNITPGGTGSLNPEWVEWLMGFDGDWTRKEKVNEGV